MHEGLGFEAEHLPELERGRTGSNQGGVVTERVRLGKVPWGDFPLLSSFFCCAVLISGEAGAQSDKGKVLVAGGDSPGRHRACRS